MLIVFSKHPNIQLESSAPYLTIEKFIFTLDCVATLFDKYFPLPISKMPNVTIELNERGPVCYRKLSTIVLDTIPTLWSQAAYQFSHELCHYMIPNDVCDNMRWFEESICEMASQFFLPKLTKYWNENNILLQTSTGELYADCFTSYIEDNIQDATPFDLFNPVEIRILESDCYLRQKNKYIAQQLLPIFQNNPLTWYAIPYLCKITPNQSFFDSLQEWKSLVPSCSHAGIEAILRVFFH